MKDPEFNPRVSIVIPVYNGSNYLREAIDSALGQIYKNIEVIVINDGSNDGGKTDKICRSYGKRIRYFKKENGGVSSALNMGIEKMEGEYFSWLSHDDVYYPEKIQKQIDVLKDLEDKTTVIYSSIEIIDQNGKTIEIQDLSKKYKIVDLNKSLFAFFHLALNGCALLINKKHFEEVGSFDISRPTTQDYDMWFRILRHSNIAYEKSIVVRSRSHSEQGSKFAIDEHVKECNTFWLNIFSSISDEEISELGGTEKFFYDDLYHSFKNLTRYDKVIDYLCKEMLDRRLTEYWNLESKKQEDYVKDIAYSIFDSHKSTESIRNILSYGKKHEKRIVFFTANWFDRGGLNRVISKVSSLLSNQYDVFIVCMKEDGNENGYEFDSNVHFLEIDNSEFLYIPKLLKLLDVDIFIGSNNTFVPLISMYPEMENLGIRVVMWNHEHFFLPYYEKDIRNMVLERTNIYNQVSVVLWLTQFSARLGKFFTDRAGVMENPVSFEFSGKYNKERGKNFNIISVARFDSPIKHLDLLLVMFSELLKKIPNAKLYIMGKYNLDMITQVNGNQTISDLIKRLKIPPESYVFTGEVKNVEKYYSKCMINVMTSEREGFGLTIIEAAAMGIPSVVFSGGGMSDIVTNGVDGFVVERKNTVAMAEKIAELLEDNEVYIRMSKSALRMSKRYSEKVVRENWIKLLNGVLTLPKNKLSPFLYKNFYEGKVKEFSQQDMKDVVNMYEEAFQDIIKDNVGLSDKAKESNQYKTLINQMENSTSWKITKPLRRFRHLLQLFKIQGVQTTCRNIVLKMFGR